MLRGGCRFVQREAETGRTAPATSDRVAAMCYDPVETPDAPMLSVDIGFA